MLPLRFYSIDISVWWICAVVCAPIWSDVLIEKCNSSNHLLRCNDAKSIFDWVFSDRVVSRRQYRKIGVLSRKRGPIRLKSSFPQPKHLANIFKESSNSESSIWLMDACIDCGQGNTKSSKSSSGKLSVNAEWLIVLVIYATTHCFLCCCFLCAEAFVWTLSHTLLEDPLIFWRFSFACYERILLCGSLRMIYSSFNGSCEK